MPGLSDTRCDLGNGRRVDDMPRARPRPSDRLENYSDVRSPMISARGKRRASVAVVVVGGRGAPRSSYLIELSAQDRAVLEEGPAATPRRTIRSSGRRSC
jgi:hypothetical protein